VRQLDDASFTTREESPVFRSFFPNPKVFFSSAVAWVVVAMVAFYTIGPALQSLISLGPWLGIQPTEAEPDPFFSPDKVWLYQYMLMTGYLFAVPWYFFGDNRRWFWWSVVGSITIMEVVFFNVQISAWLNDWYGDFYNLIQTALATPNSVTFDEFMGFILTVAVVLVVNITMLVLNLFLTSHYLFRWRRAMTFQYMANWKLLRHVEGASQRIQEDTRDFSRNVEVLGVNLVDSLMTLIVFLPILWGLSQQVTELPWIGPVDGGLVWVALISAAFGTVLLWVVGIRLPGLEFHNQRVEAAFRKELVYGEDYDEHAKPLAVRDFFKNVQRNYFRLYFNYLYFNIARYAYLQGAVFIPYIAMGPSITTGVITFGVFQQVLNAFGQVSDSFRYLVNSWTRIIELISIYKRLAGFEANLPPNTILANDYDDDRYLGSWDAIADPPTETTPVEFQWALVEEPRENDGFVSVWYDLSDKARFPGSRTKETVFPYSEELAAGVRRAMDVVRSGGRVTADLGFFQQRERVQLIVPGPGAIDEIPVSGGRMEAPDARMRPVSLSFPNLPQPEPAEEPR
jgi:peptide/bleomycin uptake transporter